MVTVKIDSNLMKKIPIEAASYDSIVVVDNKYYLYPYQGPYINDTAVVLQLTNKSSPEIKYLHRSTLVIQLDKNVTIEVK